MTNLSNGRVFKVKAANVNCTATWMVYCIFCPKCGMQYVGMTTNLKERMANHRSALKHRVRRGDGGEVNDFMKGCFGLYSTHTCRDIHLVNLM